MHWSCPHRVSEAAGRICTSDKFPGAALGPGATLGEPLEAGDCPPPRGGKRCWVGEGSGVTGFRGSFPPQERLDLIPRLPPSPKSSPV